ncbi:MAG TPA: hypothetical protein VNH22_01625 [Blastocatellia bacterium]|jgi:uncharacterized protein (TIGR02588 family)|nr:hypothetical protein [Blastocatellia bacterium]
MSVKEEKRKEQSKKRGEKDPGIAPRSRAEWVSLLVALLLLALVVGTVVAIWLDPSAVPARFRVARGAVRVEGELFYLPVVVSNDGDATGAQVTVTGKLEADGEEEEASTTFDFVPGHSQVEGSLIFGSDPVSADVRVTSYQKP